MPIRVIYVKVGEVAKERRDVWRELATDCQRATNMIWRLWEQWHSQQGSADKIKKQLDEYAKTKKKTKGGVACLDKMLSNQTYHALAKAFPALGSRTRVLLQNTVQNKIKKHPGTTKLPGWMSILLDYDGRPTTRKAAPIPFDADNASLVRDGKGLSLRLRIDRNEIAGKKNGVSTVDIVPLLIGRERKEYVAPLYDIADGKAKFAGSNLVWLPNARQWKVAIAYDAPSNVAANVDPSKTLLIRPGKNRPWRMRVNGRSMPLGGKWEHVAHKRNRLLTSRFGRMENYRWATRNAKGHGRQRGIKDFTKLTQEWRCFCKSNNQQLAARIVELAIAQGCGKIVYVQWSDDAGPRYLSEKGQPGRQNATAWPWYDVGTIAKNAAQKRGIEVVVAKTSAAKRSKRQSPQQVAAG